MNRHRFCGVCVAVCVVLSSAPSAGESEPRISFEERGEIRALINALGTGDDDAFVRTSRALKEKGSHAVPFLISALSLNPSPKVRYQAARVLAQIRDERGIDALFQASRLDPDDAVRKAARASLDALIEKLNTPDLADRVSKDYRLFDRGSIFSLRKRLKTDRLPSVRQRAAETLAEYGDERDLDSLFELAKGDRVAAVRQAAVKAIVDIAYPIILSGEYRVTFFGTLTHGPDSFRERMLRWLVGLFRNEPDASVRLEVVKGLTRLAYPTFLIGEDVFGPMLSLRARSREVILGVRDCLLSALTNDPGALVRKEAAASLTRLFMALFDKGDQVTNEELRLTLLREKRVHYFYPSFPGSARGIYRRSFAYYPSQAWDTLKPVLDALAKAYSTDPDPRVRTEAVAGLSVLGRRRESRVILNHLPYERSEDVWLASVQALGEFGAASAAEALLNVYRRTANSVELRKAAVSSIGKIGTRKALRGLASYIAGEPDREVRLAVVEAVGYQRDDQTAAALTRACQDKDAAVRAAAATAAGTNFTDETVPVLKQLLAQDPDERVRAAACTSLSKALGKDAADLLIAALKDEGAAVRRAAAVELGLHEIARSVDFLAAILRNDLDETARAEAATSLGRIGGQKSVKALVSAVLDDYSPLARGRALDALLETGEPRTAIIAILAALPGLATDNPTAYQELNNLLFDLRRQAHGRDPREW